MNIAINGYEAVVPRFGYDEKTKLPIRVGSGVFSYEVLINLNKIDKKNTYRIYLPTLESLDPEKFGLPQASKNWEYVFVPKRVGPWTITALPKKLSQDKKNIDVFFSSTHYLPIRVDTPSVIAILDVSYLKFPQMFKKKDLYQLKIWGGYSIKRAKKIITISESSKNDIIKQYGVDKDKVAIVYPGIKEILNIKNKILNMDELRKKFGISKDYILFVGTLQPRKNIVRLIEAFAILTRGPALGIPPASARSRFTELRAVGSPSSSVTPRNLYLVIIGKKGWKFEEIIEAPEKFGVKDRVIFVHSASDDDLPSLYKNALCFVLPSLYEGFGLPVLEAMKYGCPVLTSNVSSLPEAGGDAAEYFDPEDVNNIAEKIEKVLSDQNLREEMVKKGYNQIKKFSWEKTARETLRVLEEVASG